MSHFFTEDQKLLRESVRRFVDEEVRPRAVEIDRSHEFPVDLWKRLGELELTGITVPVEYGGLGDVMTTELMVMEEIGRVCPTLALILDVNYFTIGTILDSENPEIIKEYIPKLAKGEMLGATSGTEPVGSSNISEWPISAVLEGDEYVVNATKIFCTSSKHFDVVALNVISKDEFFTLVIDRDHPGISTGELENKLGLNGSDSASLTMKDVRVPVSKKIPFGQGPHTGLQYLEVSGICLGATQEVFDRTLDYLSKRQRFGGALTQVGYVGVELAKIATDLELARNLLYNAGRKMDEGQSSGNLASMCKGWITEMAVRSISRCIELHGCIGFSEDTGLARLLRDVQGLCIAEGSTGLQSLSIQLSLGIVPFGFQM